MRRFGWLASSLGVLVALTLAGCDDDDDPDFTSRESGALDNGERCMATAADAPICKGHRCIQLGAGAQFGVCSEPCTKGCRHGGTCVTVPGDNRYCLIECETGSDCPEGFGCLPDEEFEVCTGDFSCSPAPEKTWCIPLPQ